MKSSTVLVAAACQKLFSCSLRIGSYFVTIVQLRVPEISPFGEFKRGSEDRLRNFGRNQLESCFGMLFGYLSWFCFYVLETFVACWWLWIVDDRELGRA